MRPEDLPIRLSSTRSGDEQKLRLVVEAAPNAMLMINASGVIVLVNTQTERLFGYERSELLNSHIEMLLPERYRGRHVGLRTNFFTQPVTRFMGEGKELFGLRKDATEVPVEIGLSPVESDGEWHVLASIIDITERLRVDKVRRATRDDAFRQLILDSLPFSTIATDINGQILTANPAADRLLGYDRHELVGKSALVLHDTKELKLRAAELTEPGMEPIAANYQVIVKSGSQGMADEREWTYVRKDGTGVPVNIAITSLRDDAGNVTGFLKVAYDITARKRAENYIRHMAHHDALTGLPNRALLMDRLEMAIHQGQRHARQAAVLMIDLDHFKRVNDSLGHQIGDQLLLTVAKRLQGRIRDIDTVARLGGDEFVVVLNEVSGRETLTTLIDGLAAVISDKMLIEGHELAVTPSIGGCLFPDDGVDASTLLKHADAAMYQAKAIGRSNFQWFDNAMLQATEEKLALGLALGHAIERNELTVHYQPEVSISDRHVVGMEALVRWSNSMRGEIEPDRFVPIAEESGLILTLGEWVLRKACRECVEIQRELKRMVSVAVNVSPRQFQQKEWMATLVNAINESRITPSCLELEITEGMLMENPEESARKLHQIRKLGVKIVVDDFGTGYSSLSYLTRFPIDKIKIDRSFVRDLATDAADAAVIDAIIALAKSLNIRVIAEGVETEQQHSYMFERGCDEAQGFLYGAAVSSTAFAEAVSCIESN